MGRPRSVVMSMMCVIVGIHEVWDIPDPYIVLILCNHSVIINALHCTGPVGGHSANAMEMYTDPMLVP